MFLEYFKEYSKKNSFRLKRNTDAIIKRFQGSLDNINSIEELVDVFDYKTIRSFNDNVKEFVLGFYNYLELHGYSVDTLLKDIDLPTDVNSRRLAIAKFIHDDHTLQDIQDEFNISKRTAEYDIEALKNGIIVNGTKIQLDIKIKDKSYCCTSTIHPIFLPLNLTEVYALTNYLPKLLSKSNSANNKVLNDILKKIECQLSDYALDILELEKHNYKVTFRNEREMYKDDKDAKIMFALKSGIECVLMLDGNSYKGIFEEEKKFKTDDKTIDLTDKEFDLVFKE